ncbi:MAG: hypothetical protein HY721_06635 [Planctomycetes bacterium]|nr:hypothetical protein [Planctomycetota bacterium]
MRNHKNAGIASLLLAALLFCPIGQEAHAYPPGFGWCVKGCPSSPPAQHWQCWWECYAKWCKTYYPPEYTKGCYFMLPSLGSTVRLRIAAISGTSSRRSALSEAPVDGVLVPYIDAGALDGASFEVTDLDADANPLTDLRVWHLPAEAGEEGWVEVGRGSLETPESWKVSIELGTRLRGAPAGTIAFEAVRAEAEPDSPPPFVLLFLGSLTAPEPTFRRADSNGDGRVDIGDAISTLTYLFSGGAAPGCTDAADANDTGDLDLSDGIFTLQWLFAGGNDPPAPGPFDCGSDGPGDALGCTAYDRC